jgi:predicted DNA-binding transcriptional regulator YafY
MLDINHNEHKVSIQHLAESLSVSKRTIYRHIGDDLKQEIKNLNEKI